MFINIIVEQVTTLETELREYKIEADRRNQLPRTDTNDVTNSNSIANHIDGTIGTNNLKEEIERLKGTFLLVVFALVYLCLVVYMCPCVASFCLSGAK